MTGFRRAWLVVVLALLASCSTLLDGPHRPPTAGELAGVYEYGHAGFAETLELHADGTYKRTLHGHLGQEAVSFSGTWQAQGSHIEFTAVPGQREDSAPEPAESFFHRHRPAFAPVRMVKSGKVDDWFVYLPRAKA